MRKPRRKIDNTAKIFSLEENNNTFRLSIILKEKVNSKLLEIAINKTLNLYSSYKVKIKPGFFWNYLEINNKKPIVEEEKKFLFKSINYQENNEYLFKVTYFNNKINLDVFHVLTDGLGALSFLKDILYNYLNLKYNLKINDNEIIKYSIFIQDENIRNANKRLVCNKEYKRAYIIKEKSYLLNKTYHYILDLKEFKSICKKNNVSISIYLTALYLYALYKTVYNKSSNRDIIISIPIDLRKYYNVESLSNFFTCMDIEGNVLNNQDITFDKILKQVHKEFMNKLTLENIKKYLARDVKLGTNIGIRIIPLFIKKIFIKYFGNLVTQNATTTLSNIGLIEIKEQYKKYIDNIVPLVSTSKVQKVKCTICSYENNLTVTINSNLVSNKLEEEFYKLLSRHVGKVKLENSDNAVF